MLKALVHVVLPGNVEHLFVDHVQLLLEEINKAARRIKQEWGEVAPGPTRLVQVAVIGAARQVVVIRQQVCCHRRDAGRGKDPEFDEPRGTTVAVTERMDPSEVHVRSDGLEKRE